MLEEIGLNLNNGLKAGLFGVIMIEVETSVKLVMNDNISPANTPLAMSGFVILLRVDVVEAPRL